MNKQERLLRIKAFAEKQEIETTILFSELPFSKQEIEETVNDMEAYTEHKRNEKEALTSDE